MLRIHHRSPTVGFALGQTLPGANNSLPGGLIYQAPTHGAAFTYGLIGGLGNAIGIAIGLAVAGSIVGRALNRETSTLMGKLTGLTAR